MGRTMTAWCRRTYGPARGTAPEEVAVPAPAHGEVLLRIRAAALNAGDVHILHGDPLLVRPVFGLRRPTQPIRGMDVAGVIVAVADDVVSAEVGEEVVAELPGGGGLAAFATVPAARLAPRPPDVAPAQAATIPIAGGTARQALDLAEVGLRGPQRQRVLVIGASGGVGTFAVQLAALRGADVWASCRAERAALVERLGAARTFDHRQEPLETLPGRFDAIVDIAGRSSLRTLRRLLRPQGIAVLVGGEGGRVLGPVPRILAAAVSSLGSRRRIRSLAASSHPEILKKLMELVEDGLLVPVIEREYAFADAVEALARIESGHVVGKVVVRVDGSPTVS